MKNILFLLITIMSLNGSAVIPKAQSISPRLRSFMVAVPDDRGKRKIPASTEERLSFTGNYLSFAKGSLPYPGTAAFYGSSSTVKNTTKW